MLSTARAVRTLINNNPPYQTREEVTMSNKNPDKNKASRSEVKSDIKEKVCYYAERIFKWSIRVFSIKFSIDYYNRYIINTILDKNVNVEEKLKTKLRKARFSYNVWNGFVSGFMISFFATFITVLFGNFLPKNIKSYVGLWTLAVIFIIISGVQAIFLRTANTSYEKMKLVEDELEKIEKIRDTEARCEEMKALEAELNEMKLISAELNEMKLIKAELEKINNAIQNRA